MANRAYLFFLNKRSEWEAIEWGTTVPSLWQELCSTELLLQQKERVERELLLQTEDYNDGIEEERDAYIKIPKNIALDNLKNRIEYSNKGDSKDRTQLRKDFYTFLEEEVSERGEGILINISEIYDLCDTYYDCLLSFHTDEAYYREVLHLEYKSSMVGYCETFLKYSELYSQWKDTATTESRAYFDRRAKDERKVWWKELIKDILWFVISFVFLVVGVLAFIVKQDYKVGIGGLLLGLGGVLIAGYKLIEAIKSRAIK